MDTRFLVRIAWYAAASWSTGSQDYLTVNVSGELRGDLFLLRLLPDDAPTQKKRL